MPDVGRIADAHYRQRRQIRDRVEGFLASTWDGMGSYRDADIDRMVKRVVPVVRGAQAQVSVLTAAYLAAVVREVTGETVRPGGARRVMDARGVPAEDVYRRPGVTVWTALAQGATYGEAVRQGRQRLLSLGATDVQMAARESARSTLGGMSGVVGYRRVLTGTRDCALCSIASTQRYHKGDLLPIHPGCDCGVDPIIGRGDPGQVINRERLDATHADVAGRTGDWDSGGRSPDHRKIQVREHGEYGPTLTFDGQHFTGPADI